MSKKTLVIGASDKPERYSNKAMNNLLANGHEVVAIGAKEFEFKGVEVKKGMPTFEGLDTVTMYINPLRQADYEDYIIGLNPKRVIFNPGTENSDFALKLNSKGIETEEACTLVLLSVGAY